MMKTDRDLGISSDEEWAALSTSRRSKLMRWWKNFQSKGLGFFLTEHTPLVRTMSAPETTWTFMLFPPLLLLAFGVFFAVVARSMVVFGLFLLAALALLLSSAWFWLAYRADVQRRWDRIGTNPGLMRRGEAESQLSAWALSKHADHSLPATRAAVTVRFGPKTLLPAHLAGIRLGTCHGVGIFQDLEVPLYCVAPTRAGKTTGYVIPMVMEAPGPVIVTSSKLDVIDATIEGRRYGWVDPTRTAEAPGPGDHPLSFPGGSTWIFDPAGVAAGAYQHTLNWDPVLACRDPEVARKCATSLVGSADVDEKNALWGHIAIDITQALLHAAALAGSGLDQVYRWSLSPESAMGAADVLMEHQAESEVAADWAQAILALQKDERLKGSKFAAVTPAFSALSIPGVRRALSLDPTRPRFDIRRFLLSRDTIYLLAPLRSTDGKEPPGVGVFISMLISQIRDEAHRLASSSSTRKLEPPLSMILDEIGNITAPPELPSLYTAASSEGIWVASFFQSRYLAKAAFHDAEPQMWESSAKLILGGLSQADTLRDVSALTGQRRQSSVESSWSGEEGLSALFANRGSTRTERVATLSADEILTLPMGIGLYITRSLTPAAVQTVLAWERNWRINTAKENA